MPSIQTSLLMPMPAGVGQTLRGLCRAGVRRYIAVRAAENATIVADAIPTRVGGHYLLTVILPGVPTPRAPASTRGRRDRGWSPPTLA